MANVLQLNSSLFQSYFPMALNDEEILANLEKMKEDLEIKIS